MARQEATCWRCGTRWTAEDVPPTTLQVARSAPPPAKKAA